jgi:hypothetical protein
MAQGVSELLANLKRASKKDDVPGSVINALDELCPICGKKMKLYRPCCGSPNGYKGCNCGYKYVVKEPI